MKNKFQILTMGLFFIAQLFMFNLAVKAVTAYPYPIEFTQPDGSKVTILLRGDEKVKWALTTDGYTLMSSNSGTFEYAVLDNKGDMKPSGVQAHNVGNRTATELDLINSITKGVFYSEEQLGLLHQIWDIKAKEASKGFPTTGNRKLICILMSFTDKAFVKTNADFTNLFNQIGYNANGSTGSIKDYFLQNSYTQLTITTDVFGPYTAANNMAYYGANDANGDDVNPRALITEAVNAANASANYADYDNDGDGTVDGVYVVYAGFDESAGAAATCIWAHAWNITPVTLDGKIVSRYSCSSELRGTTGTNLQTIGVICHEFGHVLGAPDFYDTNYATDGSYTGTGNWDLQAGGSWNGATAGGTPAHSNPYTKCYIYNWATPTLLTSNTSLSIPNSTTNAAFYRYNTPTTGEFWLIENRQQTGMNLNVPYHGMMIYHVDQPYILANSYYVNAKSHQGMYPVCAGATGNPPTTYGTIDGTTCPFPGTGAKTTFTDATTPNSKAWNGANTGYPISNIVEAGGVITACFIACPAANDPTAFTATASSTTQIDLSWTKNASSNPVMIAWNTTATFGTPTNGTAYVAGNTITGGGTVIYNGPNTTFNHTGLTPGTTYYYKAWSVVPTNTYSTGVTNKATTLCAGITTFPWNEGFENGGIIPNCWSQEYVGNVWNWKFRTGSASGSPAAAHGGTYNANFYEGAIVNDYSTKLITPQLNLGTYSTATLKFWHTQPMRTTAANQDILAVYYKNSATGPWIFLTSYTASITAWTQETIVLPYLTDDYYVAFQGSEPTSTYGQGICLDDIQVTVTPVSTPPVIDFTVTSRTPSVGEGVKFTDLSSNVPTAWAWSFSPTTVTYLNATTSTTKNPQVSFNNAGTYNVTLKASNAFGTNTSTKTAYITTCSLGDINATGQWVEQASGFATASRGIDYISIVDENTVWATAYDGAGSTNIREFTKTTNGGATWVYGGTFNGVVTTLESVSMIYALDVNTAYAPFWDADGTVVPVVGKTTNGGANWAASCTFASAASFPNVVHFFDANNGFCMGDPNGGYFELYTTSNGGTNWTRVPTGNIPAPATGEYGVVGLYDAIGDVIWFTTNKGYVYKSVNKGLNWTKYQIVNTTEDTNMDIEMMDANNGICKVYLATTADYVFYRTIDGGQTWTSHGMTGPYYNSDIAYIPGTCDSYVCTGMDWQTVGGTGVSYSTDGGSSWSDLNSPKQNGANVQIGKLGFYNNQVGWAGGFSVSATQGGIFKYYIPQPPVADFVGTPTFIAANGTVTFQDASTNVPTAWSWSFPGGTPATSSVQNPTVTYATAGTYNVSLTVSNALGSSSITKTGYITVAPVLVKWLFNNGTSADVTATDGISANLTKQISNNAGGTMSYTYAGYSTYSIGTTNWNAIGKYWQVDFVTTGYNNIKVSSKMTGSTTAAARDFKLQYSLDNVTYTDVAGATMSLLATNWNNANANLSNVTLPSACDNKPQVYLRWTQSSTTSIAGGAIQNTRLVYMDDIIVLGSAIALPGDVNGDGFRNILDVVWLISHVNGSTPVGFILANADVNADASINVADVAALINLIMGGAKNGQDLTSNAAHIYLEQGGNVEFESDGSLLALQFKFDGQQINRSDLNLLLGSDYNLAFNEQTGSGIIYSMNNTNIPAGRINLLSINNVDLSNLLWGFAEAANTNFTTVPVITHVQNSATNVAVNSLNRNEISVVPNPNNGNFTVKLNLNSKELIQMELIDEKGKAVSKTERKEYQVGVHEIKNSNLGLANGLYIFRVTSYDNSGRKKEILYEEKIMIVK